MNFQLLNPYIRYFFITDIYFCSDVNMYADDYRLFLGLKEGCNLIIDNKTLPLQRDSVAIIPPKTFYHLEKVKDSEILIMDFDMDSSHSFTDPLDPIPAADFKKETEFSSLYLKPFDKFVFIENAEITDDLISLYDEYIHRAPYYMDLVSSLFKAILIRLARVCAEENHYPGYLKEILKYLDEHFIENPTNTFIAKKFGFNPNYLSNIFMEYLGTPLHSYITNKKALYAKQLLVATDMPICEIAKESGFTNQNRFSEFFKNKFNMSPTQFRKAMTKFEK